MHKSENSTSLKKHCKKKDLAKSGKRRKKEGRERLKLSFLEEHPKHQTIA